MNHDKPTRIVICPECAGLGITIDGDGNQIECPVCEGERQLAVVTIPEYEYEQLVLDNTYCKVFIEEVGKSFIGQSAEQAKQDLSELSKKARRLLS